ncbi:inner centromere protein A-like [Mytilus edulis]|uniref:inner centromere protein A-like n=1 Tax=Mytilus edulis TaxID=6550 RepID=UPI0039F00F0E
MNFKFVIAWSSLWLPLTIGQGCPYSRTVVPGDAKRYIEMVHNIAHERHCAPGTEFDPTTCECSLLSSGAWSPGLAFIDGLATAYPELANMPLDVLQKEILLLSSPTMYPTNVNSVPSSFQKPTRLNNQRKQQIDMFSPSSLNTQQILDLFQNVRPEDIPPDVLNDLEHLMFLENGPSGSNIIPTQNVFTHLPTRHNNERTFIPAQNEHVVGAFRNMRTQNQFQNPGSHSQNPSQLLTTKPTPTFREIKDLIASFQNLLTKPTLQSNIITPLSQTHSTQNPTIQKKNALDNFQSLANSILKAFPPKTPTPTRPSVLVSPVASPPLRNHSPSSVPIGMRTSRIKSKQTNKPNQHQRTIPQPIIPKKTENLSEAPPLAKPKVNTLPKQWIYWGNADGTKTKPAVYPRLDSKTEKKTERLSEAPPLAKQMQIPKVNTLPKQWIYWRNVDGTKTKPAVNHRLDSKAETMKMDQSKTNIKSSSQIDRVLSVQKLTTPVMQPVNKSQRKLLKSDTKIQKTPPPTTPKPASPSEDKTPNPQEEMSATKVLKMIKKQLKEAKKTGNLPFSLLKTLLEKRSMLMKKLKEERRRKKNNNSQNQPESKKSNKMVDKQDNETIKSKPVNEQKSPEVLQEQKENLETISTSENDSSKGKNQKQVNETSTSEQKKITNQDSETPHTSTKSNENQQTVQNVIPNFSFSSGASQPSIQGTDHNRPKSKRRKSKTAEFSYKPAQNGISSQSYDLLSLLSGKPILESIPSRKVSTPVEKSTPQLRGLSQTIPNNSPKLDLFSRTTSTKSRQSSAQLNTPLLDQDLETITAFLRERNALKSVNPRTVRNSFVAESYPTTLTKTPDKSHVRTLTLPTEKPKPRVQLTHPESTQSNLKTVNKQQAGSAPSLSKIDEQKRLILQKLMQRLSALQAKSSNSGNGVSMNVQSVNNNGQSFNNNGQSVNNNGHSFNNIGKSVNNNGMSQQNSNSQFNGMQMSTLRQSPSTSGQASSKTSPYNMMFRSIAMKEGASDAQEIMQDRMTEMGGAGALSMGMPMSAMNSEVRSQLGSTLFENSPMAFLL